MNDVQCEQVCQFDVHYLIMQNSEFITGNKEYYFHCAVASMEYLTDARRYPVDFEWILKCDVDG